MKWPKYKNADISYARMILISTNLNHDMHKMRLAESPNWGAIKIEKQLNIMCCNVKTMKRKGRR